MSEIILLILILLVSVSFLRGKQYFCRHPADMTDLFIIKWWCLFSSNSFKLLSGFLEKTLFASRITDLSFFCCLLVRIFFFDKWSSFYLSWHQLCGLGCRWAAAMMSEGVFGWEKLWKQEVASMKNQILAAHCQISFRSVFLLVFSLNLMFVMVQSEWQHLNQWLHLTDLNVQELMNFILIFSVWL